MSGEATTDIRLDNYKDWRRWNDAFISQAIDAELWKSINPKSPGYGKFLEEPEPPKYKDYEARPIEATDNLDSKNSCPSQPATCPTTGSSAGGVTTLHILSACNDTTVNKTESETYGSGSTKRLHRIGSRVRADRRKVSTCGIEI